MSTNTYRRYGRIIRTRLPHAQLASVALAEEVDRRVVMVMGPSGVKSVQIAARTNGDTEPSGLAALATIGYTAAYVQRKLAEGFSFFLFTFDRPEQIMKVATWRNTLAAVAAAYPEIAHLIARHGRALKNISFAAIEETVGFSFAAIDKLGPADPRYMTLARLLESPGSVSDLRRFLYHVTRLTELYSGDGYTAMESEGGEYRRGIREYVIANRAATSLTNGVLVPLVTSFKL
jgi:hypothetical protein